MSFKSAIMLYNINNINIFHVVDSTVTLQQGSIGCRLKPVTFSYPDLACEKGLEIRLTISTLNRNYGHYFIYRVGNVFRTI